jgi:ankyrin repeat and IBR domain-containing protein 1
LEAWKKHSSTTGGYFQCNRYETVNKIVAKEKELVTAAEHRHLRMVELNKVRLSMDVIDFVDLYYSFFE